MTDAFFKSNCARLLGETFDYVGIPGMFANIVHIGIMHQPFPVDITHFDQAVFKTIKGKFDLPSKTGQGWEDPIT